MTVEDVILHWSNLCLIFFFFDKKKEKEPQTSRKVKKKKVRVLDVTDLKIVGKAAKGGANAKPQRSLVRGGNKWLSLQGE